MTDDIPQTFADHLHLYVRSYSVTRAALGVPMSDTEIVSALIAVLAHVLTLHDDAEYQARALHRAHEALDMLMERPAERVLQ